MNPAEDQSNAPPSGADASRALALLEAENVSAAELRQALETIQRRAAEVRRRHGEIAARPKNRFGTTQRPGPVRQKVVATGTPAELVALDRESELLEAEQEQLKAAERTAKQRLQVQQAKEQADALPASYERLRRLIEQEAEARQAARAAADETDELIEEIRQVRDTVRRIGLDGAQPSAALLDRLLAARGMDQLTREQASDLYVAQRLDRLHQSIGREGTEAPHRRLLAGVVGRTN